MKPWERVEQAASEAITQGAQTSRAQTVAGTIQAASQTTPGALTTTFATNAGFAGLSNVATDTPEAVGVSWLVTLWFQGIKHSPRINQDRQKWFWLLIIAFVAGTYTYWALSPHHDIVLALGKALANAGTTAANAIANYHTVRPLNWFESAEEMP